MLRAPAPFSGVRFGSVNHYTRSVGNEFVFNRHPPDGRWSSEWAISHRGPDLLNGGNAQIPVVRRRLGERVKSARSVRSGWSRDGRNAPIPVVRDRYTSPLECPVLSCAAGH